VAKPCSACLGNGYVCEDDNPQPEGCTKCEGTDIMSTFEVLVGNIGIVHETTNERDALFCARTYVDQSKSNRGRCAGESVTVLKDGEPIEEYLGTNAN